MQITKNTRIYVAGCGGMLGEAVYNTLHRLAEVRATDIDVNEPWLGFADVRDFDDIWQSIKAFTPDVVINLAALTDMEQCERNPTSAWQTNALGAENVALAALRLDATYVYISTAGIFDGKQEYYCDFDTPNPLSFYAKSKFHGELFARERARKSYVIRAGWMMGGGPRKDKKFINKLYKQLASGTSVLNVVNDKAGTPTYTWDFARGIVRLLESDLYGVYNQVCGGSATRYDVAEEFVRLMGLDQKVSVNQVQSDFFKKEYFAPRPASEKLVTLKLNARNLNVMRDWRDCLREYATVFLADLHKAEEESVRMLDNSATASIVRRHR